MDMRVKLEFLIPGVQHAEEADLRRDVLDHVQSPEAFPHWCEQEIVDDLLVLQGERHQLASSVKPHAHSALGEAPATRRKPAVASAA